MRKNAGWWASLSKGRASGAALAAAAALATVMSVAGEANAQPFDCSSPDPALWPPPAKPYFMIAFDTSGSMGNSVGSNNSCNYGNSRVSHGRCAIKNTMQAFAGQANFGLATFARQMSGCSATCYNNCGYSNLPNNSGIAGCGPEPTNQANSADRRGANILVPMLVDSAPPPPNNVAQIIGLADNNCTGSQELFADGNTPLNGILRDMYRYYSNQWTHPAGAPTYVSPLTSVANGERACRSVNVILVTDGAETCDNTGDANAAAAALLAGFTKNGIAWSVKTFVIDFAGGAGAEADQIAAAGGTVSAYQANDEATLSVALANIIGNAVKPEICNNTDDNCNTCIDEGYPHYCNIQAVPGNCCAWGTPAQRTTCLNNYTASITPANPDGNLTLLPCTTQAQQQDPNLWLCYNPKEVCDNLDNNCQNGVDEGVLKCGNPPHCPIPEVCNAQDDDCDNLIDDGLMCNNCVPSPEICDGCDNDCDGTADEGISPIPCGLPVPPNCQGQLACNPPQPVPIGGCAPGGGFGMCSNAPQAEFCDGLDNNCDGQVDNGVPPVPCVPPGTPGGLIYGGTSQCQMGLQPCNGTCQGFIGPTPEVCDGIDNDCDGQVDEGVLGVGQPCGINQPPCTPGVTACVNGTLVCQGGSGPQPEICDGIDNNCNGQLDDPPLADAPAAGQNGCWLNPGNCCQFPAVNPDITWCPPLGATCNSAGVLAPPCSAGTLLCSAGGWICVNPKLPQPEVCDGFDNNCNGMIDEGLGPPVGDVCGSDVGECQTGLINCVGGVLDCVGDVTPSPEICDGLDNDCESNIDNGVQAGGPCQQPYDTMAYPGPRSCPPGQLICSMGMPLCVGGTTPQPEVCDGIDNDCDGMIDETGPQPDGIDGTPNQFPPPNANIGDVCGINVGECTLGAYACLNGFFACLGGQGPSVEQCDCKDNDCNGAQDNPNPNNQPPLCSAGKDCIESAGLCQCAAPCGGGEFPCPAGQVCVTVTDSETGQTLPDQYCVIDYCVGGCADKTTMGPNNQIVCGPPGTQLANCVPAPTCACSGPNGCQNPCYNTQCPAGLQCTEYTQDAGTCVADSSCWHFPCQGCGLACHFNGTPNGACVTNPCTANSCQPGQVCKPSADFMSFTCVESCAGVTCGAGQICKDGVCIATCTPPCAPGQVCDTSQNPPACVADQCNPLPPCTNTGACCDPLTGLCGDCPCEGVVCPAGQVCQNGDCFGQPGTGGSGGAGGGAGGGATTGSGQGGIAVGTGPNGVFGNPTGGGGCNCKVASQPEPRGWHLALLGLVLAGLARRKKRSASSKTAQNASRAGGEVL